MVILSANFMKYLNITAKAEFSLKEPWHSNSTQHICKPYHQLTTLDLEEIQLIRPRKSKNTAMSKHYTDRRKFYNNNWLPILNCLTFTLLDHNNTGLQGLLTKDKCWQAGQTQGQLLNNRSGFLHTIKLAILANFEL